MGLTLVCCFLFAADVPARLHAVMQHANYFDDARLKSAKENHMRRARDWRVTAFVAVVTNVETANAGTELGAINCRTPLRLSRDTSHRRGETGAVARPRLFPVKLLASSQDRGDVRLRRLGEPISRHAVSEARRHSKVVEIRLQTLILDLGVVAAIERCEALLDRQP